MKKIFALVIIAIIAISSVSAFAQTQQQKEENFKHAISELEAYLESTGGENIVDLKAIEDAFEELGGYEKSNFFKYYVKILSMIKNNEFSEKMVIYLDMLDYPDFGEYLDTNLNDSAIRPVEELKAYALGRENEYNGNRASACEYYFQCLSFFDAMDRYEALQSDEMEVLYDEAVSLFEAGNFSEAYPIFNSISRYKDSSFYIEYIQKKLGSIPNDTPPTPTPPTPTPTLTPNTSTFSQKVSTTSSSTPQPTLALTVTPSIGYNILSWNSISDVTSYVIKRHKTDSSYTEIATSKDTSYKDSSVSGGYKYFYTVTAKLSNGKTIDSNENIKVAATANPQSVHTHSWVAADCTHAKKCSTCGATEGSALGHNWKAADCTNPKTCQRCGATTGSALGHNWKDADCTHPKTCQRCGATTGSALGHSWNPATEYAPKTCSRCSATEGSKITWTSWSDWSTTPVTASATREVNTKTESEPVYTTKYHYSRWRYWRTDWNNWGVSYAEYRGPLYGGSGTWQYKTTDSPLQVIEYVDGRKVYTGYWYNETTEKVQSGTNNIVYYQYRDRIQ